MIKICNHKILLTASVAVFMGFSPTISYAGFVYTPEKYEVKKTVNLPPGVVKTKPGKIEMNIKPSVEVEKTTKTQEKEVEDVTDNFGLSDTPIDANIIGDDVLKIEEDIVKIEDISDKIAKKNINNINDVEKKDYQIIEGFGSDINLVIALRQIVPAKYAFSFSDDVDMSKKVSWTGGKPWNLVLNDMMSENNMTATIKGDTVLISNKKIQDSKVIKEVIDNFVIEKYPSNDKSVNSKINETVENKPKNLVDDLVIIEEIEAIAPAPKESDIDKVITRTWLARQNASLDSIIKQWSEIENIEAYIMTDKKYYIKEPFIYKGSYADAVNELLMTFSNEKPRPMGRLHSPSGNDKAVLVIESK